MKTLLSATASALLLMVQFAYGASDQSTDATCKAARALELPGFDMKVAGTEYVSGKGPSYCLVNGSFEHRTGADGKPYAIGFSIALPDDWSGRFLVQGGGGLNGVVKPPIGDVAAGANTALARGFAVISHDSGHRGEVWDGSFKADQLATLNFAGWSVEKVAALGKAIVSNYYGTSAHHSYFAGCSTGGREAMTSAQRFPLLFDGIIAGAPAIRTGRSNMSLAQKNVAMNRISPVGTDGVPDRSAAFSDADRKLVLSGILNACDKLDGIEDGMIANASACKFDPSSLICASGTSKDCLRPEQAKVVAEIFSPTLDASGRTAYPAFPYDSGIMSTTDAIPGLMRFDDKRNRQFANHAITFDVDDAIEKVDVDDPQQRLINVDQWTDLSSFASKGSKIIFFHGMSDPWFSANDTIDFFSRMKKATKTNIPADDWARLYLVPGMSHCRGGPGGLEKFDMLTKLVDWVENGKTPQSVDAGGAAPADRTRPLCPYPSYAHYKGEGDANNAASFECRR
ncbi:feruloyl esterase [Rhizobium petrolearium]|uniref:tannase/feruloyl esterase family alpha/beta hydrolase n=1 Tax=Neorhizobium petrolearium TaxID=515361 RepID=UPI001AE10CF8|nr:tannase/feruloyl esterase family alpha/beta hydrolase [Neorhizobium petrolearium]MBP1847676.1 feruloyl esterase [Neorhizobium petrolearium]